MFVSCFKLYKSGKKYLFRANVKANAPIYDQYTNKGETLSHKDVLPDKTTMICILEIQGIRFTSQSFQFEVEAKQIAVVSPDPYLDTCFVKIPTKSRSKVEEETTAKEEKDAFLLPASTALLNDIDAIIDSKTNNLGAETNAEVKLDLEPLVKDVASKSVENAAALPATSPVAKSIPKTDETDFSMLSAEDIDDVKQALNVSFNPSVNVQTIPAAKAKGKKTGGIKIIDPSENQGEKEEVNVGIGLLDFEDMNEETPFRKKEKEQEDEIEEIVLGEIIEDKEAENNGQNNGQNKNSLVLKKPEEIYREMFRVALEKADEAKRQADQLYLEANEIKEKYGLPNDE